MKFVVALLLGTATVQAVSRKHQHRQADNKQLHQKLDKLDAELNALHKEYDQLAKEADLLEGQPVSVVQASHKHGHRHHKKFATGMKWGDKLDQTIKLKDTGKGGRLLPVKLSQNENFVLAGDGGPALPKSPEDNQPLWRPRGEKGTMRRAENFVNWADYQTESANEYRPPYQSQVQFDLSGKKGSPALPDAPSGNEPLSRPRGEKQWQGWAQDFVDWEDERTEVANSRIPYASSLLGLDAINLSGKTGSPALPDLPAGNKESASPRGEKQWQTWAQDFVDWEDQRTDVANARIPYASTLLQFDMSGATGSPGLPDAPAGNKPLKGDAIKGEKEWQTWAQDFVDWEDQRTDVANSRIPYQSTLVQTDDLDMETMEERLPVSTALAQTHYEIAGEEDAAMVDKILMSENGPQDAGTRMETMTAEDVPLDQRLIFIQNQQGDQAVRLA